MTWDGYERHIFICTNRRPEGHFRGCCASRGGEEVRARFKALLRDHGLPGRVRANGATCLDVCELGASVVVYPEGVWYKGVRPEDVDEIFREHILEGRPVERFLIREDDIVWLRRCRAEMKTHLPRPVPYEEDRADPADAEESPA